MFKSKKNIIIIAIVVAVLAIIGAVTSDKKTPETTEKETAKTEIEIQATTLDELYKEMCEAVKDTKPKTSARVDAIASFAEEAATWHPTAGNKDIGNEAAALIIDNYPNYFESDALMEKLMLCGYYLENSYFGKDVADCGHDVVQAVKGVYRGAETPDSDSVKANLEQIAELIK